MKKFIKRIKKRPILVFAIIFFILFVISTSCLIYSILRVANIENLLRYLISTVLGLLIIYFAFGIIKIIFKGKNAAIIVYDIIFIILFVISSYACTTINNIYSSISNIYKNTSTYEVSLIALNDSKIKNIDNIKNIKIGIISEDNQKEIFEVASEIIDENKLKTNNEITDYNTSNDVIKALYNNEIDVALVPSNYVSIFSSIETYSNIKNETKEIITKSKTFEKVSNNTKKNTDEPFTVLVLGMDSTIKDISTVTSFNADSLMLITFNPKTYNATILSIPRDTYVPISCINGSPESKITHSGWNGESCVISTIENWMDIKIDYYVKVNFTAVVSLVDAIGGIEVDVPYSFCEQNSNREWGKNTIYVKKGKQTLNGEQALALSRNRHPNPAYCSSEWTNYYSDDIVRGQNQQLVINALINKAVKSLNIENMYSIFDVIDTNVDTNMQINEITSYYNVVKDIALKTFSENKNVINFERLQISTYGKSLYDPLLNMGGLSMQIYYEESFNKVANEMKVNLGLTSPTLTKTFTFSINEPFKDTAVGSGSFTQQEISTVPNFVGKDLSTVQSWANQYGINVIVEYEENSEIKNNSVISQSIKPSYRIDKIGSNQTFKVVVSNYIAPIETPLPEAENPPIEEQYDPLESLLPN